MIAETIRTHDNGGRLRASLGVPKKPCGIIVFAHGSGSSHLSPRNQFVAACLNEYGFATLLVDLLTQAEEHADRTTAELRFDIRLLAKRLVTATRHVRAAFSEGPLPVAYFGASTGAAAALVAATQRDNPIFAIVSRGGRPDLAKEALPLVRVPTLLIAGSLDPIVLELNRQAQRQMRCQTQLEIVPGASHLFEEPGRIRRVADLAAAWFSQSRKGGMSVA